MFNQTFNSGGFEKSSPRDARFMEFVAKGPGIAGFKLDIDPEVDGDEAAQFIARADKVQMEETDLRLNRAKDWAVCDSLEALTGLGVEFADTNALEAVEAFEDDEEIEGLPPHLVAQFDEMCDEDEGALSGVPAKYLEPRREGNIVFFRSADVSLPRRRPGAPRFGIEAHLRGIVEVARRIGPHLALAANEAKPEPPNKGNGKSLPPVGKYLRGTVVDQGHKGLMVDIGHGLFARVPIADERGHGSWDAAANWILGFKPGTNVRIRVIRVNDTIETIETIEAILSDRHPRPWWRTAKQSEQEARPAN